MAHTFDQSEFEYHFKYTETADELEIVFAETMARILPNHSLVSSANQSAAIGSNRSVPFSSGSESDSDERNAKNKKSPKVKKLTKKANPKKITKKSDEKSKSDITEIKKVSSEKSVGHKSEKKSKSDVTKPDKKPEKIEKKSSDKSDKSKLEKSKFEKVEKSKKSDSKNHGPKKVEKLKISLKDIKKSLSSNSTNEKRPVGRPKKKITEAKTSFIPPPILPPPRPKMTKKVKNPPTLTSNNQTEKISKSNPPR